MFLGRAEFAAAFSNAGGFGIITAINLKWISHSLSKSFAGSVQSIQIVARRPDTNGVKRGRTQ